MGDHFWPAMYPGLIVGILYGLSQRGFVNTIVATIGALIGAAIAYAGLLAVDLNDGLPSVIGLVAAALFGAYLFTSIARKLFSMPPKM